MAYIRADLVKETTFTHGTGNLLTTGATIGSRAFADVCSIGDTFPYALRGFDLLGIPTGEFETGVGTYVALNTIERTTVKVSSNNGSKVPLSGPQAQIEIAFTASDINDVVKQGQDPLIALAKPTGASLVGFSQTGIGVVARTAQDKLRDSVSIKDYGAVGDGEADDTAAIQEAFDAIAPGGEIRIPAGKYKLTDAIQVTKPVHVVGVGPGSYANDLGSYVIQTDTAKNAFMLVASTANYAFGQCGIIDVHFSNLSILGESDASRGVAGIGVDTTVNGGDFHIRGNSFTNVRIRYFQKAYALTGIAYLNNFFGGGVSNCGDGAVFSRGASSDVGGQNRFFGWTAVAVDGACISYFEDTAGGSIGLHGCTLSESSYGFKGNQETKYYSSPDCEFESNTIAAVYFPISGANPNTSGAKTVFGKFLTNGADIWVDKTTSAYTEGGFVWPMKIDDAYLGSANGLKVTVPAGHAGIDSPAFILGENITGPNNGTVNASQISTNFLGTNQKKRRVTRRLNFDHSTPSGSVLASLPSGMIILTVKTWLTTDNSSYTAIKVGNQVDEGAYAFFDGSAQAPNTPVTYAPAIGFAIDGGTNQIRVVFTAPVDIVAGVVEVDGYIP